MRRQYSDLMASFAERMGKRAARSIMQSDDLDTETRTELWNLFVLVRNVLNEAGSRSRWDDETASNFLGAI